MLNFPVPANATTRMANFLERHPHLSRSLPADIAHNPQHLARILDPVFAAPQRCALGEYYIQAITDDQFNFLSTNLINRSRINTSALGQCWLLGRSTVCAFPLPLASVSRLHAILGYCTDRGFYLIDLGSRNGTLHNQQRMIPNRKQFLRDGDVIQLSHVAFKFLIAPCDAATALYEMTQPLSAA
jgi:pSer/pThr/pTyr-binding forkhead associated (FHA) protein